MELFLKEFEKLKNEMNCCVCSNMFINPVRIKTCGHYFCENCLDLSKSACPECAAYFQSNEIDYNNIARESMKELLKLNDYLKWNNSISNTKEMILKFHYQEVEYNIVFLEQPTKIKLRNGSTLYAACRKNNIKEVDNLLQQTVDLNIQNSSGWTPLHLAVESKNYKIAKKLIEHGALINIPGFEYVTPLHLAAISEDDAIIKLLLKHGANKDALDYNGKKPLDHIESKSVKTVYKNILQIENRAKKLFLDKKIIAYCFHIDYSYENKLRLLKIKITKQCDFKKITHFFIKVSHKVCPKILFAMLEQCFIVHQELIEEDLLSQNPQLIPLPVTSYNFVEDDVLNKGIHKALLNSLLKMPRLFDRICFHVLPHDEPFKLNNFDLRKNDIIELIKAGNGKILTRSPSPNNCEKLDNHPYHARQSGCFNFIIFHPDKPPFLQYKMAGLQHKSTQWLVDCIVNFTILP